MLNKWLIREIDEARSVLDEVRQYAAKMEASSEEKKGLADLLMKLDISLSKLKHDEFARTIYPKFSKGDEVRRKDHEGAPAMYVDFFHEGSGIVHCSWMVKGEDGVSRSVSDKFGPEALEFVDPNRRTRQELLEEAKELGQRDERARQAKRGK